MAYPSLNKASYRTVGRLLLTVGIITALAGCGAAAETHSVTTPPNTPPAAKPTLPALANPLPQQVANLAEHVNAKGLNPDFSIRDVIVAVTGSNDGKNLTGIAQGVIINDKTNGPSLCLPRHALDQLSTNTNFPYIFGSPVFRDKGEGYLKLDKNRFTDIVSEPSQEIKTPFIQDDLQFRADAISCVGTPDQETNSTFVSLKPGEQSLAFGFQAEARNAQLYLLNQLTESLGTWEVVDTNEARALTTNLFGTYPIGFVPKPLDVGSSGLAFVQAQSAVNITSYKRETQILGILVQGLEYPNQPGATQGIYMSVP
jgi:hypothetical protein